LLVVVAAQAKLTPIFFLGLLLVIDERPRWSPFLGASALFALCVCAHAIVLPDQTREFLASISALGERGWGDPSTLGVMEDLVDQLRGIRVPLPLVTAHLLYLAAIAVVCALAVRWWGARRGGCGSRPAAHGARHHRRVRARDAAHEGLLVRGAV